MDDNKMDQSTNNLMEELYGKEPEKAPDSFDEAAFSQQINQIIEVITNSVTAFGERLANIEKLAAELDGRMNFMDMHMGYLLSKDPEIGPKLKARVEAEKENGKKLP